MVSETPIEMQTEIGIVVTTMLHASGNATVISNVLVLDWCKLTSAKVVSQTLRSE